MSEKQTWKPGPIAWIVLALLLWGGYLAVGAFTHGQSHFWQRGLMVFGVTVAFVAFWGLMLVVRRRRLQREDDGETLSTKRHKHLPHKDLPL
jgi:protein-S-isoprenylcysteine O-methyltransferase Ste14